MKKLLARLFVTLALAFALEISLFIPAANAHKLSDAFMEVDPEQVQLSIALKDLDAALETLDGNDDRQLTYGELTRAMPEIVQLLSDDVKFYCDGVARESAWRFNAVERRNDGAYVRFSSAMPCPQEVKNELRYRLLLEIDSSHRLLLTRRKLPGLGAEEISSVLASERLVLIGPGASLVGANGGTAAPQVSSSWNNFLRFIPEGVFHIGTGWDHLAFVLALLLPIRLWRLPPNKVVPTLNRAALVQLASVVTAFTIGHSVTLAMSTLKLVSVNGQWVEALIAFTIAISAMLNLLTSTDKPKVYGRFLISIALVFGLIHGFGFSSILSEMGVTGISQLASLAGFNIGIELGQLACIALWLLAQFWLCRWRGYAKWVVQGGSWALLLGATLLTIYRASA
jgi:HupE / UreJ protein